MESPTLEEDTIRLQASVALNSTASFSSNTLTTGVFNSSRVIPFEQRPTLQGLLEKWAWIPKSTERLRQNFMTLDVP